MRNLLGYIREQERKYQKNCFVCSKVLNLSDKIYQHNTCSKECAQIATSHSYFDRDGKLKLTKNGLNKIK